MSNDINSNEAIVELVKEAKHRPLPRSTRVLFVIVIFGMVFTGGIAYGKHKATAGTGTGLSLSALSGGGGLGAGNLAAGRNRRGVATAGAGTVSGDVSSGGTASDGAVATVTSTDVAGTVVSIDATSVVIQTLAGEKQTFPIQATTRVRVSTKVKLRSVKAGDIVTIKPDGSNNAKAITVVK